MSVLVESQPWDIRPLDQAQRDALIVSAVLVDGAWRVLSQYGDSAWRFHGGATNRAASKNQIDFNKVPEAFREQQKAMLYRYLRRGRFGNARASSGQVERLFTMSGLFLRFLEQLKLGRLSAATPMVCAMYVHECRSRTTHTGKPVDPASIKNRLLAVEALYDLSQFTNDPMPSFPWPDDSAWNLVSLTAPKAPPMIAVMAPLLGG